MKSMCPPRDQIRQKTRCLAAFPNLPLTLKAAQLVGMLISTCATAPAPLDAKTHVVTPGQPIQSVISQAEAGDTILVEPAIYHESLYIDKPGITLRGLQKNGRIPRLDGQGTLNDGVIASGSNFSIDTFEITHYKGNGVMTQGAHEVDIRNLIIRDTGIYGIYPTLGKKIRIENNVVSGIADAGIYIGMCEYIDVKNNEVFENVAGIEIENSRYALVAHNTVYNNTGGILVFALPGLPKKKTEHVLLLGNQIFSNNHWNFGAPGSTVSSIPPGSGVIVLASSQVDIVGNIIRDHTTSGLIVVDHQAMPGLGPDPEVNPNPVGITVRDNLLVSPSTRSFAQTLAWYHYVGRTVLAGNASDAALDQILPKTYDIYSSGRGQGLCVSGLEGFIIHKPEAFQECDPKDEITPLMAALTVPAHGSNVTSSADFQDGTPDALTHHRSRDLYRTVTSFAAKANLSTPTPEAPNAPLLGETVYNNVCSGCHALNMQRVGPSLREIATKYARDPDGIVRFATNPLKVRTGFPLMPSQAYLGQPKLEATARYILDLAADKTKIN